VVGRVVVADCPLRGTRAMGRRGGEPVRGAGAAAPRAVFCHVALPRRSAAHRATGLEGVHARVGGPQAVIGRVVVADRTLRGPRTRGGRGGEPVRGADAAAPRAALRPVALARRGATRGAARLERAAGRAAGAGRAVHSRALVALLGAVEEAV